MAVKQLEEESTCILSEAIISAASTSYLGPFTPIYRSKFIASLIKKNQGI